MTSRSVLEHEREVKNQKKKKERKIASYMISKILSQCEQMFYFFYHILIHHSFLS